MDRISHFYWLKLIFSGKKNTRHTHPPSQTNADAHTQSGRKKNKRASDANVKL